MSRALSLAIAVSVMLHLALVAYFLISANKRSAPLKRGSIAVDLIQSVSHSVIEDPHHHPGKKAKKQDTDARSEAPTAAQTPAGDPNTQARESDLYILAVMKLINAHKIYPRAAVEREEEGRVVVGITLDREGHMVASRLEEKSPFDSLNQAALDTIKTVARFPPIPEVVPEPIHLHVPLIFKLENR